MAYEQFLDLPAALIVQIIRKCYPLPYARLRQSCRFLDEFCEKHRKSLGIHGYRKDTHLHLTHSLKSCTYCDCGSVEEHHRADSEVLEVTCVNERAYDLDEGNYYLVINHGRKQQDRNFIVPMTRENLPRIRGALSGFVFSHIIVENYGYPMESGLIRKLDAALLLLIEFASEFHVTRLSLHSVTRPQFKLITNVWKNIDNVDYYTFGYDMRDLMQTDVVKNVTSLSFDCYHTEQPLTVDDILELAKNKRYLRIRENMLSLTTAWKVLDRMFENWQKVVDVPDTVIIYFFLTYNSDFTRYDVNFLEESTRHLPPHAVYIGKLKSQRIWIIKVKNHEVWRIFTIKDTTFNGGGIEVKTMHSRHQLIMWYIDLAQAGKPRPVDDSHFYDTLSKIKAIPLENVVPYICRRNVPKV